MKKRKLGAFLLILVLLTASLSACGKRAKDKETETGNTGQEQTKPGGNATAGTDGAQPDRDPGEESKDGADWSWPLPEKKELSMWIVWNNNFLNSPDEVTSVRKIEEQTNVHVNWTIVNQQEAQEKFGLMMASGDFPDILRGAEGYYTGGLVQAITDGVVVDLTDYVPKYMPTYQVLRTSIEKLKKDTVTDDGRIAGVYTLASKNGDISGERVWDGLCIRQDWLDESGLSAPVTINDWHNVLTVFKKDFGCEAPLLIGAANGYDITHNFLSAYGVLGEFYNDNNTVKYGPLEDGYRQWVELFRQWYSEGLIDPNFVNNDAAFSGSGDYIGTGRAGACANIWGLTADYYKTNGYTDDENYFLAGVTTPVRNEGDTPQLGYATSELTKETLSVTTNCKDIELACRWLDYWYDKDTMFLASLGVEGESYKDNGDGTYSIGSHVYELIDNGTYPSVQDVFSSYTLMTSNFGLYNWEAINIQCGTDRRLEAYDAWDKGQFDLILPPCMTMSEEDTDAFNVKYTAIRTLVQESTINFIVGTKPMEEYDQFVADLRSYGIEECIGYKQAALDRYNAR